MSNAIRPPSETGGARVLLWSAIDERHQHMEACKHIVAGAVQPAAASLAICQYEGETAVYLFGCDADGHTVTDTWHETIDEAKQQAELEYRGVSQTWECPE